MSLLLAAIGGCGGPAAMNAEVAQTRSAATTPASGPALELIAGTYTGGDSRGVYRFSFDPATASFGPPTLLAALENPSYGAIGSDRQWLYFAEETAPGRIAALRRDGGSGTYELVASLPAAGDHPCYLALSPDGGKLAVANYSSGTVALFRLDATGALMPNPTMRRHQGDGPNLERQEGPHAHWVQWDPEARFIYAVDLGADRIFAYPARPGSSRGDSAIAGEAFTALAMVPGAGPRHLVFHPGGRWVYIVAELANEVVVAERKSDGTLAAVQQIGTLPPDYRHHSQAGHIAINRQGTRLYVSNRGHDSIAVFAIDGSGHLALVQHIGTRGHWPRFFLLLEDHNLLLAANERSGNIAAFAVDAGGLLAPEGELLPISQPTFIARLQ